MPPSLLRAPATCERTPICSTLFYFLTFIFLQHLTIVTRCQSRILFYQLTILLLLLPSFVPVFTHYRSESKKTQHILRDVCRQIDPLPRSFRGLYPTGCRSSSSMPYSCRQVCSSMAFDCGGMLTRVEAPSPARLIFPPFAAKIPPRFKRRSRNCAMTMSMPP